MVPNGPPYSSCCYGYGNSSDEGEIVAWINTMPQGGQDESQGQAMLRSSVITHRFEPNSCLNIPVVYEGLKAGCCLNSYNVEVGHEVPGGFSTLIHPEKTITCCVVYGVSKCPGKVELGSCCLYREESVGEPGEEGGVADKVVIYVISDRQRPGDEEEEGHAATAHQQLLTDCIKRRWFRRLAVTVMPVTRSGVLL